MARFPIIEPFFDQDLGGVVRDVRTMSLHANNRNSQRFNAVYQKVSKLADREHEQCSDDNSDFIEAFEKEERKNPGKRRQDFRTDYRAMRGDHWCDYSLPWARFWIEHETDRKLDVWAILTNAIVLQDNRAGYRFEANVWGVTPKDDVADPAGLVRQANALRVLMRDDLVEMESGRSITCEAVVFTREDPMFILEDILPNNGYRPFFQRCAERPFRLTRIQGGDRAGKPDRMVRLPGRGQ